MVAEIALTVFVNKKETVSPPAASYTSTKVGSKELECEKSIASSIRKLASKVGLLTTALGLINKA